MTTGASAPAPPAAPTAEGTLAKTPLPHLLVYLLERQMTGTLDFVAPEGQRATVLVLEGYPSKVRSDGAYLAEVLVETGLVTDDQIAASMHHYRPGAGKLHGQVLLEMRALDAPRLLEGLRHQIVRKLENLFTWPSGAAYAYYDGFDALSGYGGEDMVTVDPMPIVWQAIKQAPSWEHAHHTLSRVGTAYLRLSSRAELDRLELTPDERQFVELIRPRPKRLYELTSAGTLGPSAKQLLLYCLLITRQVEMVAEEAHPASSAPVGRVSLQPSLRGEVVEQRAPGVQARDARASSPTLPKGQTLEESPPPPEGRPASSRPIPPPPATASDSAPPPPLSTELAEMRERILKRAEEITHQDYFQMLGVGRDADTDAIQKAYFLLARVWHPDRLPRELDDVRDACSKVFAHLSEAHQTVTDNERRMRYETLMKEGGATPDDQEQIANVLEAATNFQKAEICMKRNDLVQAEQLVRSAAEADPGQADYIAMLAWLEAIKPENQNAKATAARIEMLDRALKLSDKCANAYFYRGMLHKRVNNEKQAYRDFKQAAELNPRNLDALREVRLYTMRRGSQSSPPGPVRGKKPEPPSGLFGKFFKK